MTNLSVKTIIDAVRVQENCHQKLLYMPIRLSSQQIQQDTRCFICPEEGDNISSKLSTKKTN